MGLLEPRTTGPSACALLRLEDVPLNWESHFVAEWRNWQTHWTQNPAKFTLREGSTPSSATTFIFIDIAQNTDFVGQYRAICRKMKHGVEPLSSPSTRLHSRTPGRLQEQRP